MKCIFLFLLFAHLPVSIRMGTTLTRTFTVKLLLRTHDRFVLCRIESYRILQSMAMTNRQPSLKWRCKHHEFQWSCKSEVPWAGKMKADFGLNSYTLTVFGVAERHKGLNSDRGWERGTAEQLSKGQERKGRWDQHYVSWAHVKKKLQRRGLKTWGAASGLRKGRRETNHGGWRAQRSHHLEDRG